MRLRLWGLATVVPALVVVAVLCTAGAAAFLALHFGRGALLRQETDDLLRLADGYATAVRFYLDGARSMIDTVAALPPVRDAAAAAVKSPDAAGRAAAMDATRLRFNLVLRHSRVFDEVALLAADGTVMLIEPRSRESTQARRDRAFAAWYRDVIGAGRTVMSDLHLSPSSLEPTVVIASPVRDTAGRPVGILAGSLRLAELSRVGRIGDETRPPYGFVTDRRGLVVAHQAAPRYVQHQTDFSGVPAVQAALRGERGAGHFDNVIERVEQLGAWVPLADAGWAVVYEVPALAATAPIRTFTWSILVFAAALAVVLGGAGALLARGVVRPIRRLTEAAGRMEAGAARFEVGPKAGAEVGELAGALNRMVTAVSERDAALRERAAQLEHVVGELEAAGRAKDQFLATLSHELRTPLNAVYGWARMLRQNILDPAAIRRALEAIERNSATQAQLIEDLLDVSRIVTGKMRVDVRMVQLDEVVRAAVDTLQLAAESKGVRLQTVLDPGAGPINGDPERLQQVVWNLVGNAVKFTPRSGRVQVHLRRINSHVEIVVADTGQGIATDVLPYVFERFRQADSGSTRTHGGLGIGLALVRHLVELHGGTVHARSDGEGKGSTFIVKLPLAATRQAAPPEVPRVHPAARNATRSEPGPELHGVEVLIVDDDADALDLMATILTRQGAVVRIAASAAIGLAEFERSRPDVLLSDIEMPDEDGYGLITRIRALPTALGGNVPAAAITAYGRTEDRVRALSAGFTTHVPKPVDPAELTAVVRSLARQSGK